MRAHLLAVFLLLSARASFATEPAFFDSDDVALRYFEAGDGETVVLLHGFSGSAQGLYINPGTFDALVDAGYHVVALDQRGHGGSGKPHNPAQYGLNMVEDVRRLLDHLAVERAHLVGYSMGGKVANQFRDQYPERLATVTLGGFGWPWRTPEVTREQAEARIQNMTVLPGNDPAALSAVYAGMSSLSTSQQSMESNSVPAFAIIGDRDAAVPDEDQEGLRDVMSHLEYVVIPGTHAGPDGAPYKPVFAEKLIAFLDDN